MPAIQTVPVTDEITAGLRTYASAMRTGFLDGPLTDEAFRIWHDFVRADRVRLSVIQDDEPRPFGLSGQPVATFSSWAGTLNGGSAMLATNFISDVTVQASHNRRGLMARLMRADLRAARDRGDVFATLTASDARLYGRFGFGVATQVRKLVMDTRGGFPFRSSARGRTVFAEAAEVDDLRRELFGRFHADQFLSLSRPSYYWESGYDWEAAEARDERAAVHLGDDGNPDGVAVFRIVPDEIRLVDVVALSAAAEIELIRLIGSMEGRDRLVWGPCFNPSHPLPWALENPRAVRTEGVRDGIWLRILDVTRALEGRSWDTDGELTLAVTDPLEWCAGTYQITVTAGRASVSRTDAEPGITCGIGELAPLYSGLQSPSGLAQAGLVDGAPTALAQADRLFAKLGPAIAASLF